MKKNRRKERRWGSIKERSHPKINLYDSRSRVIGSLGRGQSINYQELLLKKVNGIHKI